MARKAANAQEMKLDLGAEHTSADTPLMRQYQQIKAKYPGAILLFRVGDFYETFGEDAIRTAQILNITLTKRGNGSATEVELAGFPHHALDNYLPRLVRAGARVAVCDQLEDPKLAKGIVKRGVTEIVTPGTALSDPLLDQKRANYLCALHFAASDQLGVAFLELSTGEFFAVSGNAARMEKLLYGLRPSEVVLPRKDLRSFKAHFGDDYYTYRLEDWVFEAGFASEQLTRHFRTQSLKGFGLDEDPAAATAAGVLLHYLKENEQHHLGHINGIYLLADAQYVSLDRYTQRNLELLQPLHADGRSLADTLDYCHTPMGARLLRRWVAFPLRDVQRINHRLDAVQTVVLDPTLHTTLEQHLRSIGDLERLTAKLSTRRMNPREAVALRQALAMLPQLWSALAAQPAYAHLLASVQDCTAAHELLQHTLAEQCPPSVAAGDVIRNGHHAALDELRALKTDATSYLEKLRIQEAQRTGIASLKINYNRVFGYYIEITHAHKDRVPSDYIRKQTLTNAERYITPELKVFEEKILSAEERLMRLEAELYEALLEALQVHLGAIQHNAQLVAQVDVLQSLARAARLHQYARPTLTDDGSLDIVDGRHPVIERLLPPERPYVPNDVSLDVHDRQILVISGPNMAGKSALLRQTALITLLAHMGSYVPATQAHIGLVDKIFTRVGASDNLAAGESTFMVEMNETARILHHATPHSLVILDEIGRGTSTYDGVSIAWALVEYLHNTTGAAAKTLFATHYHELAVLAEQLPRVHNYHVSVKEIDGKIIFLRKLLPGHSEHSFGIHVAEMAGLPRALVVRAAELLKHLEEHAASPASQGQALATHTQPQLHMFGLADEATAQLRALMQTVDVNRLTPVEALLKLQEIKQILDRYS